MSDIIEPVAVTPEITSTIVNDWRRTRKADIEKLKVDTTEYDAILTSVLAEENTIYRFPWPNEDSEQVNTFVDVESRLFNITHEITVSETVISYLKNIQHNDVDATIEVNQLGHRIVVSIPCPLSKDLQFDCFSKPNEEAKILVYGEKYDSNEEGYASAITVFKCPYCNVIFTLPSVEVNDIKDESEDETIVRLKANITLDS